MEELLNKLIKKGWKPRNKEEVKRLNYHTLYREVVSLEFDNYNLRVSYSLRDLVSKESGLWQFCCENGMIRITENNSLCNWLFGEEIYYDETQTDKLYKNDNYEYWLIESALCDEDKLEQFLKENIKI